MRQVAGFRRAVWLGLSFLGYFLGEVAAARDASVIAYTRGASSVLCLPWALYLCLPLFLWLRGKWESKQPIFGTWKYHYGKAPWAADCFPLFDERRRHCKRPRTQAQRKERAFWLRLWALWIRACNGAGLHECLWSGVYACGPYDRGVLCL